MSSQQLDQHLECIDDNDREVIACTKCGEYICEAGENYKKHALVKTMPIEEAKALMNDPSEYVDDKMEYREFYCPGCATLLENEVILADLDPIHDRELK